MATESSSEQSLLTILSMLINLIKLSARHVESASCLQQTAWWAQTQITHTHSQTHAKTTSVGSKALQAFLLQITQRLVPKQSLDMVRLKTEL